jgi:predicted aspartyl protease
LRSALKSPDTITLSIHRQKEGLILIKDVEIEGQALNLLVDTGATRSAIFESALGEMTQEITYAGKANIHGLTDVGNRDRIIVSKMKIGALTVKNRPMVVLADRQVVKKPPPEDIKYHGLIGMDILKDYHLHISKRSNTLSLIPNSMTVNTPTSWLKSPLFPNPYIEDGRDLHFLPLSFLDQTIAGLFDTGADISILNWNETSHPGLAETRKRLRDSWEFQGAIGVFKPHAKIRFEQLLSGQIGWRNQDFIVMEMENLSVLGVENSAFAIAGINLFNYETVFVNFDSDILAVETKRDFRRLRSSESPTTDIPYNR